MHLAGDLGREAGPIIVLIEIAERKYALAGTDREFRHALDLVESKFAARCGSRLRTDRLHGRSGGKACRCSGFQKIAPGEPATDVALFFIESPSGLNCSSFEFTLLIASRYMSQLHGCGGTSRNVRSAKMRMERLTARDSSPYRRTDHACPR